MTNFHGRILLVLFSFFMVILSGCGIFMGRIPAGTIPGSIPQDHVIELGGVGYHYREYPATGPDVVLLHGFASSTYTWKVVNRCMCPAPFTRTAK